MSRRFQDLELGPHANGWVIHWEPGHDTGFHDHGGSTVAIIVISGRLREEWYEGKASMCNREITVGQCVILKPNIVHRVIPQVPCTAVHIYTPKLEVMNLFTATREYFHTQDAREELDANGLSDLASV